MSISRKLGTLVVFGVPVIVGGGIVYAVSGGSYAAVSVFEILLAMTAGAFLST
jgi:zinc transporter ZupT